MKKVLAILLSVLLVCALATVAFAAFDNSSCALTADKTELKRGDTFTVTANLTNTEAVTLATVALQFDETVLELTGGSCLATGTMLGTVAPAQKAGTMLYQTATVVSGDIFTFNFTVKADAAFGDCEIVNVAAIGAGTGNPITATGLTVEVVCDHNYGAWVDAGDNHSKTCGICGDIQTADHNFGALTDNGADHKATCSDCGAVKTSAHVFDQEVVADKYLNAGATCTAKATYFKSCACGAKGTETFEAGEMAAHDFTKKVEDEANFANEATCTSGKTYYLLCAVCDAKGTETFEVGEPIAHTFDKEVVKADYLAAKATCTAKATYYKSCACGAKGTETFETGELAEHKYGEGKITAEATAEKPGVKTYTCEICGATKTEDVPYVETPATGDTAVLVPMVLLAVMSVCGMAVVLVMKKRAI